MLIAGPIEPKSNKGWVHKFIKKNNLKDNIWLFGSANRKEIKEIAYSIDCCVITSDYETFGLPALEAISAGKPVIATKCNGPESIINDKIGLLVKKGDYNKIKSAMINVYKNKNNYNSEIIKQNAFNRFSQSEVSKKFTKLYKDILK